MNKFVLMPIEDFDARRGYTRWVLPGVGSSYPDGPHAEADIWVDPKGRLVTRFKCLGYTYSFVIEPLGKFKIIPDMKGEIADFLADKLIEWIDEGLDDSLY